MSKKVLFADTVLRFHNLNEEKMFFISYFNGKINLQSIKNIRNGTLFGTRSSKIEKTDTINFLGVTLCVHPVYLPKF